MELKDFAKVEFIPNETKTLKFKITTEKLKFYNQALKHDWETGDFNIFVGPNSKYLQKLSVNWEK